MSGERYAETLAALYARTTGGVKLGLDNVRALLGALGRPDKAMQHVIVAGTNGKGSTSALLATALMQAGHRVAHFTSPHLLRFTERIKIAGVEIEPADVVRLYERVIAAERACPRPPTFFELTTAMALVAFAEAGVEIAVLEVGMGGRLDATNAVDKHLAVITPVDLDHQHYLGSSIAAIAAEKAGVIPERGVVVVGRQHDEALAVITDVAERRGARLLLAAPARLDAGRLAVSVGDGESVTFAAWPPGAYQRDNLATAATAGHELHRLGLACPPAAMEHAAAHFCWPGRYQWVAGTPDLLIDGAHNPAGVQVLLAAMAEDERVRGRPVHVVLTVLVDRPPEAMVPPIAARATSLHATPVSSPRSRTAGQLAALDPRAIVHPSARAALAAAAERARADGGLVLVCGSLLLVADVLALVTGERRDPPVDG